MCLRVDPLKDAVGSSFGKAERLCTCMIMCLRVDPLKDAAGSSFGKAERLCTCMIMCLRVDPLKDAAGSSFGKADRLCLYLHDHVSSGGSVEGCCGFLIWQGRQTLSVPA